MSTKFTVKGNADRCSREYVRAWLHASACVLAFHNKVLPRKILVEIKAERDLGTNDLTGGANGGSWNARKRRILLNAELSPEGMATVILHELIHAACGDFGEDTDEKCCSTLTARLKPEVHRIAQPLVDGTYRRAAYLAHTKLSYITDEDHYDPGQWTRVGARDPRRKGKRQRKKSPRQRGAEASP